MIEAPTPATYVSTTSGQNTALHQLRPDTRCGGDARRWRGFRRKPEAQRRPGTVGEPTAAKKEPPAEACGVPRNVLLTAGITTEAQGMPYALLATVRIR